MCMCSVQTQRSVPAKREDFLLLRLTYRFGGKEGNRISRFPKLKSVRTFTQHSTLEKVFRGVVSLRLALSSVQPFEGTFWPQTVLSSAPLRVSEILERVGKDLFSPFNELHLKGDRTGHSQKLLALNRSLCNATYASLTLTQQPRYCECATLEISIKKGEASLGDTRGLGGCYRRHWY